MTAKAQKESALASLAAERWDLVSRKIADLAAAIPEEKLEWLPAAGVRSCGAILRHVAFWNQYVADSLRGKPPDDTLNELPLEMYKTKAACLEALRRTSQDVAAALREQAAPIDAKTAEMVITFAEHTSEHFGQLVVYARLMGIVPPTART